MNAVHLMMVQHGSMMCPPVVDVEDFEPQQRDRCNTWPLQKPAGDLGHNTSPLIHEEIPEEDDLEVGAEADRDSNQDLLEADDDPMTSPNGHLMNAVSPSRQTAGGSHCLTSKKNSSRRNAWGNLSYADLITQAILGSPDKRLTLSQIYDWMVHNVPYFRDKGDSNSSAGWKNSIRHNLSLHSRFMRVQNEGAGKSSWWMINPDAKHGKCSRRRTGSMEQSTKLWEKKRGRLKKSDDYAASMEQLPLSDEPSEPSSLYSSTNDLNLSQFQEEFRCRVGSTLSTFSVSSRGSAQLSPNIIEDGWDVPEVSVAMTAINRGNHSPYNNLVDTLPHSMKLDPDAQVHQQQQLSPYRTPKLEYSPQSYTTLCHQQQQQVQQQQPITQRRVKVEQIYDDLTQSSDNGVSPQIYSDVVLEKLYYPSANHHGQQIYRNHHHHLLPDSDNRSFYYYGNTPNIHSEQLPSELSEIHYDSYFKSDVQWDVDQVIRHELTLTGKLDFNDLTHI